ncbi:MAG: Smr/MutS family protein, partial [Dehalococcoidaceae bacterium]|nr:Smr/MutS family protein [Dehalococcoidaceae bacterium]
LSSFSWHMSNISRILKLATPQSLVLMDELGTSTDPLEGSALAAAIIIHLLKNGTTTVATSHFNELKALAHTTPGLRNAAFEFDPDTLLPTYRLLTGIPGGSNALITASRLGICQDIINAARERLSSQDRKLDSLLFQLANEQSRAKMLSEAAEKEKTEAKKLRLELESTLKQVRIEREKLINQARDEAVTQITELSREIKDLSAQLRRNRTQQQLELARKTMADSRRRVQDTVTNYGQEQREDADSGVIQAGDTVLLNELGVEAVVTDVNYAASQVTAESGSLRVTLSTDSVTRLKTKTQPKRQKRVQSFTQPAKPKISLELDLRGRRADEIEWLLEGYLNDAIMANLESARIIHGHGTGVLRQIVREYVAEQSLVKSFRPGQNNEGGDGVTVITLK